MWKAMMRRDRALEQRHEVLQAAMADLSRATRCSKVSAGTHARRQTDALYVCLICLYVCLICLL